MLGPVHQRNRAASGGAFDWKVAPFGYEAPHVEGASARMWGVQWLGCRLVRKFVGQLSPCLVGRGGETGRGAGRSTAGALAAAGVFGGSLAATGQVSARLASGWSATVARRLSRAAWAWLSNSATVVAGALG